VIDDPHLGVAPRGDGDGLEADGDGSLVLQALFVDAIDFEAVIGGIDGEEALSVGREGERTNVAALKDGDGRRGVRRGGGGGDTEGRRQDKRCGDKRR
jgi:hypothetical protein